jgi:hypothetical protein
MWEKQLAESGISCGQIQKVVQLSKLDFPTSNPSPVVSSPDHGLEAHVTKRRETTHRHLSWENGRG